MRFPSDLPRLLALLLVCAWAATRAAKLELDVDNRAMRSQGTPEARAEELREASFGRDATLVLLLTPEAGSTDNDEAADSWVAALRTRPEVRGVTELAQAREGERLLALTLGADETGGFGAALAALTEHAEASRPPATHLSISGVPAAEAAIAEALHAEQTRVVPLVGLVLLVLLWVFYRSLALALGSILPALCGIALTGALQQALGYAVDPVTSLLPPVLLVVGVAASVHLVESYLEERRKDQDPVQASQSAWRHILVPGLGCAATTVIGFLTLLTSPMPAVQRFGLLSAAGTLFTALIAFTFMPPWLRLFARAPRLVQRSAGEGPWPRWSAPIARALARAAPLTALAALVVALVFGWAWTRIRVDTDPLGILPASHPFRLATDEIGARLGGTETFELLLEAPTPPLVGFKLLELQTKLLGLDGIVGPAGPPRHAADGTALLASLLRPSGTTAREELFSAAEGLAHQLGWAEVHATGLAVRIARDSGALARGEAWGMLASLLTLVPCVLILRSVRLTLVGLLANALPCLLLHGGLALAGRPLSVASAMIGSVILGLVVDDAIFFLHGYGEQRGRSSMRLAVARTLRTRAQAMTVTTLVLALGFLTGLAGVLTTTREFSVLAAGSILAAWAANVFLIPSFLLFARWLRATRKRRVSQGAL
ncbi:MAG: hypothetical protein EXS08_06645 [Planctomycetes bacterium]|nr:hypothetical protein [Planctomycetota bacterium]